jgi:hypothetical protein
MEEVVGSIPTRSTKYFNNLAASLYRLGRKSLKASASPGFSLSCLVIASTLAFPLSGISRMQTSVVVASLECRDMLDVLGFTFLWTRPNTPQRDVGMLVFRDELSLK